MKAALTLLAYDDSSLECFSDDEDYLLLDLVSFSKRRLGMRLNLEDLSNMECVEIFRFVHLFVCYCLPCNWVWMSPFDVIIYWFAKEDMARLGSALKLPDVYM